MDSVSLHLVWTLYTPLLSSKIQFILENSFIWKYITLLLILKYEFYLKWGSAHFVLRVLVPFMLSFMLSSVCVCGGMCVHVCVCVYMYVFVLWGGRGQGQVSSLVILHSGSPGAQSFSWTLASDPWHLPASASLHPKCLWAEAAISSFYVSGGDLTQVLMLVRQALCLQSPPQPRQCSFPSQLRAPCCLLRFAQVELNLHRTEVCLVT